MEYRHGARSSILPPAFKQLTDSVQVLIIPVKEYFMTKENRSITLSEGYDEFNPSLMDASAEDGISTLILSRDFGVVKPARKERGSTSKLQHDTNLRFKGKRKNK